MADSSTNDAALGMQSLCSSVTLPSTRFTKRLSDRSSSVVKMVAFQGSCLDGKTEDGLHASCFEEAKLSCSHALQCQRASKVIWSS
jgi:hypothetical protein